MPFSPLIGNDLAKAALQRMASQKSVPQHTFILRSRRRRQKPLCHQPSSAPNGEHAHNSATPTCTSITPKAKAPFTPWKPSASSSMKPHSLPTKPPLKSSSSTMPITCSPTAATLYSKLSKSPPSTATFILLTSSLDSILPTIASRCRKVPFFPIPQSQIESLIKEKWEKKPEEARRIAFLSHGSLAKAKQLAENTQLPWRAQLLEILSLQLPYEYPQFQRLALELEQSCTPEDEEESPLIDTDAILEEIAAWYRDLHLLKEQIAPEYLYHLDHLDRLKLSLAHPIPPLEKVLEQIAKARLALQRNVRLRNALEHLFLN